jgi:hypothetical protein
MEFSNVNQFVPLFHNFGTKEIFALGHTIFIILPSNANPRPCNGFGLGRTCLGPRLPLPDDALKIVMRGQGKGRSGGGVVAETTKAPQRELGPRPDP